MWHGRFKQGMAEMVKDFTQSLDIDWQYSSRENAWENGLVES